MTTPRALPNLLSGIGQRAVQALAGFIAVPLYIHLLGDSQYGILSFFAAMSGLIAVIDLGLPTLISRQAALAKAGDHALSALSMHAELVSWGLGLFFGATICLGAGSLAPLWPSGEAEATPLVVPAIMFLSIQLALRWPAAFYQAAFIGVERQVLSNGLSALALLAQHGGGLALLLLRPPSLVDLVLWHALVSSAQTLLLAQFWHRQVLWPCRPLPLRFMRRHARFCGGTVIAAILAMIVQQVDKILVGRATDLATFAHYAVAGTLAATAGVLMGPLASIYFPRLSRLQHEDPSRAIVELRRFTWMFSLISLPGSSVLIFFAPTVCPLIFHDPATTRQVAAILPGLTVATVVGQYAIILYQAEMAIGAAGPTAKINLGLCLIGTPLCFVLVHIWSIPGAIVYLLTIALANLSAHLVCCRRAFPAFAPLHWMQADLLPPLMATAFVMVLGRLFIIPWIEGLVLQLILAFILALVVAALIMVLSPQRFLWQEFRRQAQTGFKWLQVRQRP